jgi:hypothetical protein
LVDQRIWPGIVPFQVKKSLRKHREKNVVLGVFILLLRARGIVPHDQSAEYRTGPPVRPKVFHKKTFHLVNNTNVSSGNCPQGKCGDLWTLHSLEVEQTETRIQSLHLGFRKERTSAWSPFESVEENTRTDVRETERPEKVLAEQHLKKEPGKKPVRDDVI